MGFNWWYLVLAKIVCAWLKELKFDKIKWYKIRFTDI